MVLKKTVGTLTIEMPSSFECEGEVVELSPYAIRAVVDDDGEALGFNLTYEIPGGGTIVNGIYDDFGNTVVLNRPLYEPDEYEHPDDVPYDTPFLPPDEFTDEVRVYRDYGDDDY
jgi:hypothetical protein